VNKVGAVEAWVNSYIIDQMLIPGDYFIVVAFYGKTEVVISQVVNDTGEKQSLKKIISQIKGNGRFTDIGNALDAVKAQLAARENDGREKYVLLLTDGIQEAPPTSKYYSKNGAFNHEFLANTKTIQEKGWKVMILGIGTDTAAKDLARELQGSYNEISNKLTIDTLTEKTGSFFGEIAVQGTAQVSPIAADGTSRVSLALKSSGLKSDALITVTGISATIAGRPIPSLLSLPFSFTVKKDATGRVDIPLRFPTDMAPGPSIGVLTFTFATADRFTPADVTVTVAVMSWFQKNLLLLIGAVVLLLIIAGVAAFLIWRFTKGKPVLFAVVIGDEPVSERPISLRAGRELFLAEKAAVYSLIAKRNAKAIARFTIKDGKVALGILKQDRFPKMKEVPADARGKSFLLRSENGRNLTMKVQSKERKK